MVGLLLQPDASRVRQYPQFMLPKPSNDLNSFLGCVEAKSL
jgi:hypothetical protein